MAVLEALPRALQVAGSHLHVAQLAQTHRHIALRRSRARVRGGQALEHLMAVLEALPCALQVPGSHLHVAQLDQTHRHIALRRSRARVRGGQALEHLMAVLEALPCALQVPGSHLHVAQLDQTHRHIALRRSRARVRGGQALTHLQAVFEALPRAFQVTGIHLHVAQFGERYRSVAVVRSMLHCSAGCGLCSGQITCLVGRSRQLNPTPEVIGVKLHRFCPDGSDSLGVLLALVLHLHGQRRALACLFCRFLIGHPLRGLAPGLTRDPVDLLDRLEGLCPFAIGKALQGRQTFRVGRCHGGKDQAAILGQLSLVAAVTQFKLVRQAQPLPRVGFELLGGLGQLDARAFEACLVSLRRLKPCQCLRRAALLLTQSLVLDGQFGKQGFLPLFGAVALGGQGLGAVSNQSVCQKSAVDVQIGRCANRG